jgi:tetratricopeptide (TPR) repeat protein
MSAEDARPSDSEIKEQMKRMLLAKRFRNAVKQASFLAIVVERALAGEGTPERVLAKKLFPHKSAEEDATHVRVTAGNLRSSLGKYYEAEGADDPVRIMLPDPPEDKSLRPAEGEAYRPIFIYHPFQAVSFQYKLGEVFLSRDLQAAVDRFRDVIALAPGHVGAGLGLVEAWCSVLFWLRAIGDVALVDEISKEGLSLLDRLRAHSPKFWKVHALAGFLLTETGRLDRAKEAFSEALSLSRTSTESYPPYLFYLAKSGNTKRGCRLAERYLELRLSDANAYIVYADVLLLAGQTENAAKVLETALQIHGDIGLAHHRLFLRRMDERRFDDAIMHFGRMIPLIDPLALEVTAGFVEKSIEAWPDEEQKAWRDRVELERRLEEETAKAIARVRRSLKA